MTELGSVIATLPMVSTLCQVAIAKAFGKATYNLFLNKGLFPASFSYLFVSWCNFCKVKSVDFGSGIKDSQSRRSSAESALDLFNKNWANQFRPKPSFMTSPERDFGLMR